jgi:hypothetical protein
VTATADGFLPAALDKLHQAIAGLVDERKEMIGGAVRSAPSLYDELVDEVPSRPGAGVHTLGRQAKSKPPCKLDALDLLVEIDTAVSIWCWVGGSTPARLRGLAGKRWRPMDCRGLYQMSRILQEWATQIDALLHPAWTKSISAACPACGVTHVYRRDSAGEIVRQPALQVVAELGCTCQSCHATWGPERYLLLCKVLGFDVPAGVLE